MKQHGNDTEELLPETGGFIVPLRDQLSIDKGIWLEMEHATGAHIIPRNHVKGALFHYMLPWRILNMDATSPGIAKIILTNA